MNDVRKRRAGRPPWTDAKFLGCALLTPVLALGNANDRAIEHTELAEDAFCVVSYASMAVDAIGEGVSPRLVLELEDRARGLSVRLLHRADVLGHNEMDVAEMVAEITVNTARLTYDEWISFVEYLDCAARTQEYASRRNNF